MKIRKRAGFTLVEVMVTVVIVAILAKISMSAYSEYLRKAERTEAKTVLLENVLSMEQLFTLNNTYVTVPQTLPYPTSPKTGTAKYNISITAITPTSYQLSAVPVDSSAKCGTFTIDNTGQRGVSSGFLVADCWGNG